MDKSRALRACGPRSRNLLRRHCEEPLRRSNPVCLSEGTGLFRCARNDGQCSGASRALRPQIKIALRLELGQTDHAPFSALTKPGKRSVSVTFCAFIVLPQAASSTPSLEKSPTRLLMSGL